MHNYMFYCQFSPPLCYEREGVFTNKQYSYSFRILIKKDSLSCDGNQQADIVRVITAML